MKEEFGDSLLERGSRSAFESLLEGLNRTFSKAIARGVVRGSGNMGDSIVGQKGAEFLTCERGPIVCHDFPRQSVSRKHNSEFVNRAG